MSSNFQKLLDNLKKSEPRKLNDHILLLDGNNTFIRGFVAVNKVLPHNGQHVGGLIGFLRSLGLLSRVIRPTRIVCVFDGFGGSRGRKNISPSYKANRGNQKLSLGTGFGSLAEEKESFRIQMERLMDYLKCLPVNTVQLEGFEADDVISLLARKASANGKDATIVSTDEDYYQLIDPHIDIYNPTSRKPYNILNYESKVIVHPNNYAVAKAIVGDVSDNIQGIKGVGFKTLVKRVPQLKLEPRVSIEEVMEFCNNNIDIHDIYAKIISEWDRIEINYKIIDLTHEWLYDKEKTFIFEELSSIPNLNAQMFEFLIDKDKIEGFSKSTSKWAENFRHLTLYN